MADTPPPDEAAAPSFESGLDQLDSLVRSLESGDLGLAESIAAYEQGVTLLRRLHEELGAIELRVKTLVQLDADGNPVFEPINGQPELPAPAAEPDSGDQPARGRRRVRKPAAAGTSGRQRLPGMDEPDQTP